MTPSEIKQLTPDGYGGDFEMTCTSEEKVQVRAQVNRGEYAYGVQVRAQVEVQDKVQDEMTMEVGE